jgi:hypothetical protein
MSDFQELEDPSSPGRHERPGGSGQPPQSTGDIVTAQKAPVASRLSAAKIMLAALPVSLASVSVIGLAACSSSPGDMTVHGTVEIAVTSYDEFSEYQQIYSGDAQVTITNPSGTVIAVAPADGSNVKQGPSLAEDMTLTWGFTAKVPEGLSFYGISVSGAPGKVQFTQAQMKQGPAVCVGDACSG